MDTLLNMRLPYVLFRVADGEATMHEALYLREMLESLLDQWMAEREQRELKTDDLLALYHLMDRLDLEPV